jgi:hypothetical protein
MTRWYFVNCWPNNCIIQDPKLRTLLLGEETQSVGRCVVVVCCVQLVPVTVCRTVVSLTKNFIVRPDTAAIALTAETIHSDLTVKDVVTTSSDVDQTTDVSLAAVILSVSCAMKAIFTIRQIFLKKKIRFTPLFCDGKSKLLF